MTIGQFRGTGNRIGHDKEHLRPFQRDPTKKDPPPIIVKIQDRIKDLAGRPRACPEIFFHLEDPDKSRQERSEGRERDAAYLCSMIDHMDEVTMRVGVPQAGGKLYRYSVDELTKGTGMEPKEEEGEADGGGNKKKQPGRFYRAASRMTEKGLVTTKHRSGKKGHGPDNLHASRVVSLKMLRAIGMEQEFSRERELESQRRTNGGTTNEERSAALGNAAPPAKQARRQRPEAVDTYMEELHKTHKIPQTPP